MSSLSSTSRKSTLTKTTKKQRQQQRERKSPKSTTKKLEKKTLTKSGSSQTPVVVTSVATVSSFFGTSRPFSTRNPNDLVRDSSNDPSSSFSTSPSPLSFQNDTTAVNDAKQTKTKSPIEIYTDGSCRPNPGPGGWGAYIPKVPFHRSGDEHPSLDSTTKNRQNEIGPFYLSGGELDSTNNRMELMAAIQALKWFEMNGRHIIVTTDSTYLKDGITQWLPNWKKNNWKTANGFPIKNQQLWQDLDDQHERHQVEWRWTRSHVGHFENEIADQLAKSAMIHVSRQQHQQQQNSFV